MQVRVALVVEVVEHPDEAPVLLVVAEAWGVGAHRRLDGEHVLAQGRGLGPLAEEGPGFFARKRLRHGCYPSPPLDHGEARHRGRRAALRHRSARRQQERGAAAAGRQPPHRGARRDLPTSRASGTPRRCSTLLADLGVAVERLDDNTVALTRGRHPDRPTSTRRSPSASAPPSWSPARCSRASARALMPPPGGDVIGRRRLDPHLDAFRALGADGRARPPHQAARAQRRAALDRLLHGRAVRDGHRERADGRRADAGHDRASATPRREPHVQDLARMLNKMGAAIEGIGSNVMYVHGMGDAGRLRAHRLARTTSRSRSFMALAGVTGGELRIQGCVPEDLRMIRLVFERLGLRLELRRTTAHASCPAARSCVVARDAGDYQSKVEDGPWPAFPADLTSIARRARHAVRGLGPDLREDVREPPVLRGQADLDGRARSRSATRTGRSSSARAGCAARALVLARHPRRHGDADRRAVRAGRRARSTTCARSTAATSGSTSGCGTSARASSASPPSLGA